MRREPIGRIQVVGSGMDGRRERNDVSCMSREKSSKLSRGEGVWRDDKGDVD